MKSLVDTIKEGKDKGVYSAWTIETKAGAKEVCVYKRESVSAPDMSDYEEYAESEGGKLLEHIANTDLASIKTYIKNQRGVDNYRIMFQSERVDVFVKAVSSL